MRDSGSLILMVGSACQQQQFVELTNAMARRCQWRGLHRRRFYRWVYATLTLFAMFAVVAGFFDLTGSDRSSISGDGSSSTGSLTGNAANDAMLLQWMYWLYPSPMVFSWVVVYSGRRFSCSEAEGLRKASNYQLNLLLACLAAAAFYTFLIQCVIGFSFVSGPSLNSAVIMAVCSFGLVLLLIVDEAARRKRRRETAETMSENQVSQDQQQLDHQQRPTA